MNLPLPIPSLDPIKIQKSFEQASETRQSVHHMLHNYSSSMQWERGKINLSL